MFCPKCGAQNDANQQVCETCGCPLNDAPQQPAQPTYQQPVQPVPPVYQQPGQPVPPAYQQPVQQVVMVKPSVPGKGLGIASMVLGIIAIVCFCWGWVGIICGIVGLVLASVGLAKSKNAGMKNGFAVAGLVCSLVAVGAATIIVITGATLLSDLFSMF